MVVDTTKTAAASEEAPKVKTISETDLAKGLQKWMKDYREQSGFTTVEEMNKLTPEEYGEQAAKYLFEIL